MEIERSLTRPVTAGHNLREPRSNRHRHITMSANIRTFLAVLVLPLCVCAAVVVSSRDVHQKSTGLRESEEIYNQINDLNRAFHGVHQKLAARGTNAPIP